MVKPSCDLHEHSIHTVQLDSGQRAWTCEQDQRIHHQSISTEQNNNEYVDEHHITGSVANNGKESDIINLIREVALI